MRNILKHPAAGIPALFFALTVAAVLLVQQFAVPPERRTAKSAEPAAAPDRGEGTVVKLAAARDATPAKVESAPKPHTDADTVADFLGGFLSESEARQKAALEAHCPRDVLDTYSDDLVARARLLARTTRPQVAEAPCHIVRATLGDKFFCYTFRLRAGHLDVTVVDEWGDEKDIRFMVRDFEPVKCFAARWDGDGFLNELRVLTTGTGADLKVVAVGRAAYVGARTGKQRVETLAGLSLQMKETKANVRMRTAPVAEGVSPEWPAYGLMISADPDLVPERAKLAYAEMLRTRRTFGTGWVLFNRGPKLSWPEIVKRYGEPERTERNRLMSGKFVLSRSGLEPDLFDGSVIVHYYGPVGFARKPGRDRAFGIVMQVDTGKRKETASTKKVQAAEGKSGGGTSPAEH